MPPYYDITALHKGKIKSKKRLRINIHTYMPKRLRHACYFIVKVIY